MKTIAGTDAGRSVNHFVVVTDEFIVDKAIKVRGRWLYVKKCIRESECGKGIVMPERSRRDTTFLLVLAKGEGTMTPAQVNDIVSAPDDHPTGIMRSPYCEDDYFVKEDILQTLIPRE